MVIMVDMTIKVKCLSETDKKIKVQITKGAFTASDECPPVFQRHTFFQAFFTLGTKISSGSSTSWMIRSSSRVGTAVSPLTLVISRSNWHISLISEADLPGWQVSRNIFPLSPSKRKTPAVLITAEGPPRYAAP